MAFLVVTVIIYSSLSEEIFFGQNICCKSPVICIYLKQGNSKVTKVILSTFKVSSVNEGFTVFKKCIFGDVFYIEVIAKLLFGFS